MADRVVTLTTGRYRDWTVQTGDTPWQFQIISQRLTAHHPPRMPSMENLRIGLSLSISRGDPQWDLLTATHRPGGRAVNAVALETVLARIITALATRDPATDWHIRAVRTYTADLVAAAHAIAGPGTTVTLTASASHPGNQHDFGTTYRVWDRLSTAPRGTAERDDAFQWLLATIPTLPEMPTPGTDWAAQTATFLSRPFPGAPRVGQIEVVFINAINGKAERHPCRDIDEARRLAAAEYQPFNNTRVAAYRVVSVNVGIPSWEELDLAAARGPAPAHPAALARSFDAPVTAATTAAADRGGPTRPTERTHPPARSPGAPRR